MLEYETEDRSDPADLLRRKWSLRGRLRRLRRRFWMRGKKKMLIYGFIAGGLLAGLVVGLAWIWS